MRIEGKKHTGKWEKIAEIKLDKEHTETITVTNPQIYVDSHGYINLRALWINGHNWWDSYIYEIWY